MGLEPLLEQAFTDGCGISRSYALRTPRYRHLVEEVPHVPYLKPAEVAEMTYLGERLADRAFRNMPHSFRIQAARWNDMTADEQFDLGMAMVKRFNSRTRRRQHEHDREQEVYSALPHRSGSWARGPVMVSCLGMAQMLVGFARQTGTTHYLLSALTTHQAATQLALIRHLDESIMLLRPYRHLGYIRHKIRKLEKQRRISLTAYHRDLTDQAHHALLLRGKGGWLQLDPYMGKVAWHDRYGPEAFRSVERTPSRVYALLCRALSRTVQASELVALGRVARLVRSKHGKPPQKSTIDEIILSGLMVVRTAHVSPIQGDDNALSDALIKDYHDNTALISHQINIALSAALVERRDARKLVNLPKKAIQRWYDKRDSLVMRDRRIHDAALLRLLCHWINRGLEATDAAYADRQALHELLEIAHPTYTLAVMTVNHLAHHRRLAAPELILYTSSQVILHDTMDDVRRSGSKQLNRKLDTRLRSYADFEPHLVQPRLRPYITRK